MRWEGFSALSDKERVGMVDGASAGCEFPHLREFLSDGKLSARGFRIAKDTYCCQTPPKGRALRQSFLFLDLEDDEVAQQELGDFVKLGEGQRIAFFKDLLSLRERGPRERRQEKLPSHRRHDATVRRHFAAASLAR